MIEIRDLSKSFSEVTAVSHLTLEIGEGITGIVGHNGAGKSTLLRLLSGTLDPTGGEIRIDGHSAESVEAKQRVFFLNDDPFVPDRADMKKLLLFYRNFYDLSEETFYALTDEFGLPTKRKISEFSKGMKRQVFIALSLAVQCDYLLLDEAFDGLDPLVVVRIKEHIRETMDHRKAVLISSHNITMLDQLVDRYVILTRGELTESGSKEDIGHEIIKFQGLPKDGREITKEMIDSFGLHAITVSKAGSIFQIVILRDDEAENILKEKMEWTLLEPVALSPDELLASEMAYRKEGK